MNPIKERIKETYNEKESQSMKGEFLKNRQQAIEYTTKTGATVVTSSIAENTYFDPELYKINK